ncbi:MAG TPA: InlB B-repeat-containing protein, partial [Candidatus Spyradocola merdavium]|nr:InlB B-repeat-containing protein [Candidatus Spyradocola merdavium]
MKKAKSLLAIWLALVLTLTLFPTALAADGNMHTLKWEYDPTHITVNDSATASVTEGTDFTFSFTIASGYEFSALSVAIAGNDDYVTSAPTNSEGTYSYTIAGAELTGDVTISITAAPEASTATEYTVTYDVNGGDALTSSTVQVAVGGSVTLPTPTYADHTFLGWQPEGSTEL